MFGEEYYGSELMINGYVQNNRPVEALELFMEFAV